MPPQAYARRGPAPSCSLVQTVTSSCLRTLDVSGPLKSTGNTLSVGQHERDVAVLDASRLVVVLPLAPHRGDVVAVILEAPRISLRVGFPERIAGHPIGSLVRPCRVDDVLRLLVLSRCSPTGMSASCTR